MTHTALTARRVGKGIVAVVMAASAVVGFGTAAHADSEISGVSVEACTGGTVERGVTVAYTTSASFTTGVRLHIVSGTPDGPIVETRTVDLQGPTSVTVEFDLAPGTYYVDWEDRSGDGVTWSGRHSGLGDFYRGIYLSTQTVVAPCAQEVTTTTATTVTIPSTTATTATTVTIATTVTTTPGEPPITPAGPTPSTTVPPAGSTVSSVPQAPPTTARPPSETLVATGANSTPMIMLGTVFVGLGAISLVAARRSPRRS